MSLLPLNGNQSLQVLSYNKKIALHYNDKIFHSGELY